MSLTTRKDESKPLPGLLERHWGVKGKRRDRSMVENENAARAAGRRRMTTPISLKGVSEGKLITVTSEMFGKIDIAETTPDGKEPGYQRLRQDGWVNKLIEAIRNGGYVPDPIKLAHRLYETSCKGYGPGCKCKLWVVDGQQRMWAFFELGVPFRALVSDVESYKAECDWFLIENDRLQVSSQKIAWDWTGTCGQILRSANRDSDHPLYGKVAWKPGGTSRFIATSILRGGLAACAGTSGEGGRRGGTIGLLQRLDFALKDTRAASRFAMYLRIIPEIFLTGRPKLPAYTALGIVANKRFQERGVSKPAAAHIARLRRINWESYDAIPAVHRVKILVESVEKAWKDE